MAAQESILVVGGGISGITAAVEAAEVGFEVHLVEKTPYFGGRVTRLNQYFPKLCPPYCGLEINFRRIKQSRKITTYTMAEVEKVDGKPGDYDVTLKLHPRYVNENCTACDACVEACPVERENDFNYGMSKTKAIYRPHDLSLPMQYVIDENTCTFDKCGKCADACKYGAIDLKMEAETRTVKVGSIVVATGWQPYDTANLDLLGAGKEPDVITNVVMERLASASGPTDGKVLRPSDGKAPKSIAFVQCAGSRDENHLAFCSGICCLATLKHVTYVREQLPDTEITMFYIDIRATGRYEEFFAEVSKDEKLYLRKGKVANITRESDGRLKVEAEDTATGIKSSQTVDMVVLATGMQPSLAEDKLPGMEYDDYGFVDTSNAEKGIFAAGCAKSPVDVATAVQDATAAALKAIQTVGGRSA